MTSDPTASDGAAGTERSSDAPLSDATVTMASVSGEDRPSTSSPVLHDTAGPGHARDLGDPNATRPHDLVPREVRGREAHNGSVPGAQGDGGPIDPALQPPGAEAMLPLTSPVTPSRVGGAIGLVVGLVMLRPWLWSGEILVRDLAAVGEPILNLGSLAIGIGPSWDLLGQSLAVVAGQFIGMDNVVRVVVLGSFIGLGAGTARLAGTNGSRIAAAVAAVAATWNPFVWSRLNQGEWLTVLALAALPWVVIHLRADHRWRLARATLFAGIAGAAGWTVVVPTLLVVAIVARRLRAAVPAFLVLVTTAVPSLLAAGRFAADPVGFRAMAAQADLPSGLVTSVITGGGHWNQAVAPPSRASWSVAIMATMLAAAAMYGAGRWREQPRLLHDWRTRSGLALASIISLVGVVFMATSAGQALVGGTAEVVPWLAAIRNSTNLLAPWVLVLAIGLGNLAWRTSRWLRDGVASSAHIAVRTLTAPAVGVVLVLLVLALLPEPRRADPVPATGAVPASWALVADIVNDRPDAGAVLMVPGTRHQAYDWAAVEVVPPLQLLLATDVLADSRWRVQRGDELLVVDDDPAVPTDVAEEPPPVVMPGASPTPEPSVVIDRSDLSEPVTPTTDGAPPTLVRTLASQWPGDLRARELAELGIQWVAVVQPDQFAEPGPGLVRVLTAPDVQLWEVNPDRFRIAERSGGLLPVFLDGLIATMALALLLAAGPLRTGRELDPV